MRRIVMLTVLFVCAGTPLVSQTVQENAARTLTSVQSLANALSTHGAGVTYTLTGNLPPREPGTAAPVLPVAVVNAVRNDGHLSSLRIGTGYRTGQIVATGYTFNQAVAGEPQFSATFNFADLAEFDDWYGSRAAQDLHRAVEAAALPGSVQANLNMNKPRPPEHVVSVPFAQ